jgi:hypothetical protein
MPKTTTTHTAQPLADDLTWGVNAIAAELSRKPKQVHHMLSEGYIPGAEIGGQWVASRAKLRQHLEALFADAAA